MEISNMIHHGKQKLAAKEIAADNARLGRLGEQADPNAPVVGTPEWAAAKLAGATPVEPKEAATGIQPVDAPEGFVRKIIQGATGRQRVSEQRQGRG